MASADPRSPDFDPRLLESTAPITDISDPRSPNFDPRTITSTQDLTGPGSPERIAGIKAGIEEQKINQPFFKIEEHPELQGVATPGILPQAKIIGPAVETASMIGKGIRGALGLTTGKDPEVFKEIFQRASRGDTSAVQAMRGEIPPSNVVEHARDALQAVKDQRGAAYRSQLEKVKLQTGELDLTPLRKDMNEGIKSFGITKTPEGKWDFSRSTVDISERGKMGAMLDTLEEWGTRPGDASPVGVDTLKRALDDYISPSKSSRALVTRLKNTTRNILNDNVPGYKKMTSDYSKASNAIDEINEALSVEGRTETALNKLTSTMKSNKEYRAAVLDKLEELSGADIKGQLAGMEAKGIAPRGSTAKGVVWAETLGAAFMHNPFVLGLLAASSPRAVGEFFHVAGMTAKTAKTLADKVPYKFRPTAIKEQAALAGAKIMENSINPNNYVLQQAKTQHQLEGMPTIKK